MFCIIIFLFYFLYFAGEIKDVDSYTGGFNLQIAYSTGYTAGMHVGDLEE